MRLGDPWTWAEASFVESGDRSRLATVVAMAQGIHLSTTGALYLLEELFRYNDARVHWFRLRERPNRQEQVHRTGRREVVVYLKSQVNAPVPWRTMEAQRA